MDSLLSGAHVVAYVLKALGVRVIFGVTGIPMVETAEACQQLGIVFLAFRNEQSASYAASGYGYLTGRPGVCLVTSGPGVMHAIAGVANAWANKWPMMLLAGSTGRAH